MSICLGKGISSKLSLTRCQWGFKNLSIPLAQSVPTLRTNSKKRFRFTSELNKRFWPAYRISSALLFKSFSSLTDSETYSLSFTMLNYSRMPLLKFQLSLYSYFLRNGKRSSLTNSVTTSFMGFLSACSKKSNCPLKFL